MEAKQHERNSTITAFKFIPLDFFSTKVYFDVNNPWRVTQKQRIGSAWQCLHELVIKCFLHFRSWCFSLLFSNATLLFQACKESCLAYNQRQQCGCMEYRFPGSDKICDVLNKSTGKFCIQCRRFSFTGRLPRRYLRLKHFLTQIPINAWMCCL